MVFKRRAGLGEKSGEEVGGSWFVGGADGVEDEADDRVGEEGDDETDNSVENGVLSVGDFFAVATGENVAETAPDEHDNGDGANNVEGDAGDAGEDAVGSDELGGHTFGTSGFGAFLDGESHGFASKKGKHRTDSGDDL